MEERWKLQDMVRETKRKKMRGEFTSPTNISTEVYVKRVLRYQEREEKWKEQDRDRIKKRIEYRKKHPFVEKDDRRWIALTKGTNQGINQGTNQGTNQGITKGSDRSTSLPRFNERNLNERNLNERKLNERSISLPRIGGTSF
jgi:hypothetical protein